MSTSDPEPVPDTGATPERTELFAELSRELRRSNVQTIMFTQAIASQLGLNVTDLQCLNLLDQEGPLTAGALADLLGLSTGAVTRLVDRLVAVGMVERVATPSDRRRVLIKPIKEEPGTDRGQKDLDSMFVSVTFAWFDLLAEFSDEQLVHLLQYYRRSNELLREEVVKMRKQAEKKQAEKRKD